MGPRPFAVVAVYYDYARRPRRDRHGPRDVRDATSAICRRPASPRIFATAPSPSTCAREILERLDEGHRVFIYTNRALRREVLRIFDSTFTITYALEIIAVVVAMLGVGATLLTLVLERRHELSMLRLIGATRRQVVRVVVIEAALIGGASQAIGLVVGLALSLILVYVINVQSFGWTIQFRVPAAVSRAGVGGGRDRHGAGRRLPGATRGAARRGARGVTMTCPLRQTRCRSHRAGVASAFRRKS